jgi:hypothetical protein
MMARFISWLLGVVLCVCSVAAQAQANLDAGKSAAQIFADTCNACHRSAREIKRTTAAFLLEHYTTGTREAAIMASYLASVGSDPQAVQQRRPPTLGAGQPPSATSPPSAPSAQSAPSRPPSAAPGPEHPKSGASAALPTSTATPAVNGAIAAGAAEQAIPAGVGPRARRPSESIEFGAPSVVSGTATTEAAAASGAVAARKAYPAAEIEE